MCSYLVAAMLAACGGSQPPIGAPGAMPQSRAIATHAQRGGSWMAPEAENRLLYVAALSKGVFVYSYPEGALLQSLSGFQNAAAICTANNGNVFIADEIPSASVIYEYPHGGSSPIATFDDAADAQGCAYDDDSGTLAVTNFQNLAVYPGGQSPPTFYEPPNAYEIYSCAYDNKGNLFVVGPSAMLWLRAADRARRSSRRALYRLRRLTRRIAARKARATPPLPFTTST